MSRSLFGTWGASLPQEDFAKAVASVGVLGLRKSAPGERAIINAERRLRSTGRDIATLRIEHLAGLIDAVGKGAADLATAQDYLAAWDRFDFWWRYELPPNALLLRLEVELGVKATLRNSAPDPYWLLRTLLDNAVSDSAYVRVDEPDRPVAWEWPLRVGVLGDAGSIELAEHIEAVPWPRLIKLVRLDIMDEDCDLLLLSDNLRGAVARVLQHPRRLHADCVLAIGGAGIAAERILPLAATLRGEVLTAGVGIVRINPEQRRAWFKELVGQLSHDMPLDVALVRASPAVQRDEPGEPPLLFASRRLASTARVTAFARRLGQEVRRMATTAAEPAPETDTAAEKLETLANSGGYLSESGDATVIADIRGDFEARVGNRVSAPREGAAELAAKARDNRHVNFTVTDVTNAAAPKRVEDRLAADRAYEMALEIGLPRADVESASGRFPSERLPPSRDGHWLDVFFVPLVKAASGRFHTPLQGRLFLPAQGNSEPCPISFRTHGVKDEYRARILITHENRVIQTLIFSSPLGASQRRFALDVENVVAPNFEPAWQGKPFDAAVVVNHASDGQAGFTAVVGKEVSFRQPLGIDKLVGEVKRLLSAEATFPDARGTPDDPALLKLFEDLAHYGRAMLKAMPPEVRGRIPDGARIQIVEAVAGAWLPLEMFYSEEVPESGATLCPNARAALLHQNGVSHESCPHRDDPDHHCPLRFWGFSCVIERQPPLASVPGADYTISVPQPGTDHLDAFRSVLVGASSKVRAQDLTEPGGILEAVRMVARSTRTAADWNDWKREVQADSPSLLMLLPHTQDDPQRPGIPALEIGGVLLPSSKFGSRYVTGPAGQSPVVLLLGCSTQLTDVPFLSFVEAFKRENAALVIGTLATIRGRRTVDFVFELLDGLKSAAGSERTFGEVFLETKRKLLASGDGFVLSLTAYGDVGWRL